MRTNPELRHAGYKALEGKWGLFVGVTLITSIIAWIASLPTALDARYASVGISAVLQLLILPFIWGFAVIFLHNHRGRECDMRNLFDGYRDFLRIFVTLLWRNILVSLWTLLLIVPGIVKSYAYAMTPYILHDHPELSDVKAIHLSREMMYGHKAKLFLLHLSFIGWGILCLFTCGIGFLWLLPYVYSAQAAFYEDLRADYETLLQSAKA